MEISVRGPNTVGYGVHCLGGISFVSLRIFEVFSPKEALH